MATMLVGTSQKPITIPYKDIEGDPLPIFFDLYLPPVDATTYDSTGQCMPTVVYFHGGGLTNGTKDRLPTWLINRVLSLGYAFISANYRLIPPGSAHGIVKDLQDLFSFLVENEIKDDQRPFRIDPDRLAVAGSSSGGLCAYLAAMHCVPKPKAIVSIYSQGGKLLSPHYLREKKEVFFMGLDILDPARFEDFIYPYKNGPVLPTSDMPYLDSKTGTLSNRRTLLGLLYHQLGKFLDYYTGLHDPSLTETLVEILDNNGTLEDVRRALPEKQRYLFPEINVDSTWPATIFLVGTCDTAVLVEEPENLRSLLQRARVPFEYLEFPGQEHTFDIQPGAEDVWEKEFDSVKDFLLRYLGPS